MILDQPLRRRESGDLDQRPGDPGTAAGPAGRAPRRTWHRGAGCRGRSLRSTRPTHPRPAGASGPPQAWPRSYRAPPPARRSRSAQRPGGSPRRCRRPGPGRARLAAPSPVGSVSLPRVRTSPARGAGRRPPPHSRPPAAIAGGMPCDAPPSRAVRLGGSSELWTTAGHGGSSKGWRPCRARLSAGPRTGSA